MKKLSVLLVLFCFATLAQAKESLPFAGSTKHKTVKKMSRKQVRNAQQGKSFYYRSNKQIQKRKR